VRDVVVAAVTEHADPAHQARREVGGLAVLGDPYVAGTGANEVVDVDLIGHVGALDGEDTVDQGRGRDVTGFQEFQGEASGLIAVWGSSSGLRVGNHQTLRPPGLESNGPTSEGDDAAGDQPVPEPVGV
jgi:hypothetical protein